MGQTYPIHLCIGAPCAGTDWLARELTRNPAIFVPAITELRYWNSRRSDAQVTRSADLALSRLQAQDPDSDLQRAWLTKWRAIAASQPPKAAEYRALMGLAQRPAIDISPALSFLDPARIPELRAALPDGSKVIYLVRNPLERMGAQYMLHHHLQGRYRGTPSQEDLAAFLANPAQLRRSDFAEIMAQWQGVFGDDFCAFSYDQLSAQPRQLIAQITQFLGLPPAPDAATRSDDSYAESDPHAAVKALLPRPGPKENQQIANAIAPLAARFAHDQPDLGQRWLASIAAAQDATPPKPPNLITDVALPVQKLMRMTESLGDNCEYGFWQRHRGYEPSSLFRWAITPIDPLIDYLRAPKPLYARDTMDVHSPQMVADRGAGFCFHSKLIERDEDGKPRLLNDPDAFDRIYQAELGKIEFLARKFWMMARTRPALYIVKCKDGLSADQVHALADALHALHPQHQLLWAEAGEFEGIKTLRPGLLHACLPEFARYVSADKYHPEGWTRIMAALATYGEIPKMIAQMRQ